MTEINNEMTAAQMLFEARTLGRRKREISTISKLLCIREEYLEALEKGEYDKIPELVYILGFARNYAMELGLDPEEIVAKIKCELNVEGANCPKTSADKQDEGIISNPVANEKKTKNNLVMGKLSKYVYKHWKWLLAGLVALVIVILGIVFIASLSSGTSDAPIVDETVEVVASEPTYNKTVREKFGTENAANANVIIQAIQESWVKIEDGRGNTAFSRVLVPGDVYYVGAGKNYKGTFGNAGGVDIWVNGKLAPKLGALNTRKSGVVLTAEGLIPAPTPQPAVAE